jgi:hypothetical protein
MHGVQARTIVPDCIPQAQRGKTRVTDAYTLAGAWAGGTEYGVNFVFLNTFVCFVLGVTSFPFVIRVN